jgi:hypothetical protein
MESNREMAGRNGFADGGAARRDWLPGFGRAWRLPEVAAEIELL